MRRLKLIYILYNIFHRKKLLHNAGLYKKAGLDKFYFSPVSSKDFKNIDPSLLSGNELITKVNDTALFRVLDPLTQKSILDFDTNGYAILHQFFDEKIIDAINIEIDTRLQEKSIGFENGNKIMFAINKSAFLKSIGEEMDFRELLNAIAGENVQLFQSINFLTGSEQHTHSDSIHMTTFPLGGLLGVWIALEDIDMDNGPLHYYPGSHLLPYYLNEDYDNEGNFFLLGKKSYTEYEKMIEEKIAENSMQKKVFTAKKGDVFIWHANLFHGGEPHLNKNKTRKSMVLHYYAVNKICYHEISQRPALIR